MNKIFGFLVLILAFNFISTNALTLSEKQIHNVEVKFISKNQLEELIKENANVVELTRNVRQSKDNENNSFQPRYTIEYSVGRREVYDYLVARDGTAFSWPQPRDVVMSIDYPAQPGTGRIVTYVNILVTQNSTSGRAYVTYGGIGYRYITVIVEAENTNYFEYNANIYGRD